MFRGLHEHTIDAKGRIHVPMRFREVLRKQIPAEPADTAGEGLSEQLIVTTGIDPCLVAYTPQQWAMLEARLAALPQFDPAVVQLKRMYVAGASECEIDKLGRLLVPPALRHYAGLEKEIVWAGMVTTLEIWSQSAWDTRLAESRKNHQAIAKTMTELGL